mmetsp:Transcript_1799/g.3413  ORF Transcript_1799/g.3413 Transcript_1799/m.3413 type:complete len:275 (-) Transcript_1799:852-1676(-)
MNHRLRPTRKDGVNILGSKVVGLLFGGTLLVFLENIVGAVLEKLFHLFLRHDVFVAAGLDSLEDCLVEAHLHTGHVKHLHLICFACEETVNLHILCLTNSMASCLRLEIILRIPIRVKYDTSVSSGKVNTHTARTRGQQHDERLLSPILGILGLESINRRLTLHPGNGTVDPFDLKGAEVEIILDDVQHDFELAEEQNAMTIRLQPRKQLVQQYKLPRSFHQLLNRILIRILCPHLRLHPRQQERMIATLPQLHCQVINARSVQRPLLVAMQKL